MKPKQIQDAQAFGKVAVAMGGRAAERAVSLKSGMAVWEALRRSGVEAYALDLQSDFITPLQQGGFDRVFNIIHGRGGEDGVLQAILEALRLPYTGSGVMASAISMDKLRTKLCWHGAGLPTPPWYVLENLEQIDDCIAALDFPMIVKPACEGSSLGMSQALDRASLIDAWRLAKQFQCEVYAEQWVRGHEYTVGILAGESLPVIRLETPRKFYDYEAKYQAGTTRYHCPCGLSPEHERALQDLALSACHCLGITGWARVDVFIDHAERSQLIEVNTVPGMTDHSLVPMAARAAGIEFDELVWRILETSLAR